MRAAAGRPAHACVGGRRGCVRRYSLAVILAAGLLVLAGLGLFVAGLATGTTDFYWSCVACCAVAAVLLLIVRLRPGQRAAMAEDRPGVRTAEPARTAASTSASAPAATSAAPTTAAGDAGAGAGTAEESTGRHSAGATAAAPRDDRRDEVATPGAGPAADGEPDVAEPTTPPVVRSPASTGRVDGPVDGTDPAEEDVEVTDLLLVVDMRDEVLVVDEHPRYHLADCAWLGGRATIPLPVAEARGDGFTPCAVCRPDSHLADLARARKAARK